jgi:hypothetical protein
MPVRLMVWNIERFAAGKMSDPEKTKFIKDSFNEAQPDIFIIIEGQTGGSGGAGTLISDSGGRAGVLGLWKQLPANWKLVPPMLINPGLSKKTQGNATGRGYSESIIVFFNSTNLAFAGPNKWTEVGSEPLDNHLRAIDYPAPFGGCLPPNPSPLPLGPPQNRLAGRASFLDSNNYAVEFGSSSNLAFLARSPWRTDFQETAGAGRTIKIWTVHFAPDNKEAQANLLGLNKMPEITDNLVANEVRVICGDFNIQPTDNKEFSGFTSNLLPDGAGVVKRRSTRHGALAVMTSTDMYDLFLGPRAAPTMLRGQSAASLWGVPPNYGYTSTTLDNVLVAPKGVGKNFMIVNRVVGTPYTFDPSVSPQYSVAMHRSITRIVADTIRSLPWTWDINPNTIFRRTENYGHIRTTSDHMALVIDL